jgi:hypothetical protein
VRRLAGIKLSLQHGSVLLQLLLVLVGSQGSVLSLQQISRQAIKQRRRFSGRYQCILCTSLHLRLHLRMTYLYQQQKPYSAATCKNHTHSLSRILKLANPLLCLCQLQLQLLQPSWYVRLVLCCCGVLVHTEAVSSLQQATAEQVMEQIGRKKGVRWVRRSRVVYD